MKLTEKRSLTKLKDKIQTVSMAIWEKIIRLERTASLYLISLINFSIITQSGNLGIKS
jgi:hypothetical protein